MHRKVLDHNRQRPSNFKAQKRLADAVSLPIQRVASHLADSKTAGECIVLRSFLCLYMPDCKDQKPCSSNPQLWDNVRVAFQRSLSMSAHGQSHMEKQEAEPHRVGLHEICAKGDSLCQEYSKTLPLIASRRSVPMIQSRYLM
jgi:hypothetical protein